MKTALAKGSGQPLIEQVSGTIYTAAEASAVVKACEETRDLADRQVERWKKRTERAYDWRDRSLMLGIVAYAAAKVWAAAIVSPS